MAARWLAVVGALAVLLVGVPSADAVVVSMTDNGLLLSSGDSSKAHIDIAPNAKTADGSIASWKIVALGCGLGPDHACLTESDSECSVSAGGLPPPGGIGDVAICERSHAGVTVTLGAGDDIVSVTESGAEKVTMSLGKGNDESQSWPGIGFLLPTGTWTINGGDGNDRLRGSAQHNVMDGGDGNDNLAGFPDNAPVNFSGDDSITGGAGDDRINPGTGSDQISAGTGDDYLIETPESFLSPMEGDAWDGGTGQDTLDYSQRTSNIFFNSGSTQSGSVGSTPDEQDRVSRVNNVILGSGNDTALSLIEDLSRRRYEGRDGDDVLNGLDSPDTLIGGNGADKMNGFKGDDNLMARDGTADKVISCGEGTDFADLDLKDPFPIDGTAACETIQRGNKNEPAFIHITAVRRSHGRLQMTLTCPRANARRCKGSVKARGRAAGYNLTAGQARVARLGRVGPGKVSITASEAGAFGPETVIVRRRV